MAEVKVEELDRGGSWRLFWELRRPSRNELIVYGAMAAIYVALIVSRGVNLTVLVAVVAVAVPMSPLEPWQPVHPPAPLKPAVKRPQNRANNRYHLQDGSTTIATDGAGTDHNPRRPPLLALNCIGPSTAATTTRG